MSRELPARPDLEHYRKEAKTFVRAFREADGAPLRRAEAVLGRRARKRFALSDAQYVIAVEHGYASWAELRRACEQSGLEALARRDRGEIVLDYDRRYTEGAPVEVFVTKRKQTYDLTDRGNPVRLAGKPRGWLDVAERVVEEFSLNVNRRGVVFVGTVYPDWVDPLASRIADASLAVYEALLELDER